VLNLAGVARCTDTVVAELSEAGVPYLELPSALDLEVRSKVVGLLGEFRFHRAWCYWVVEGPVPKAMAEELYADPIGKEAVRVDGDCTCPPPEKHLVYLDASGTRLCARADMEKYNSTSMAALVAKQEAQGVFRIVDDPAKEGAAVVECYHIDSQAGLNLFAHTLRKFGLGKGTCLRGVLPEPPLSWRR